MVVYIFILGSNFGKLMNDSDFGKHTALQSTVNSLFNQVFPNMLRKIFVLVYMSSLMQNQILQLNWQNFFTIKTFKAWAFENSTHFSVAKTLTMIIWYAQLWYVGRPTDRLTQYFPIFACITCMHNIFIKLDLYLLTFKIRPILCHSKNSFVTSSCHLPHFITRWYTGREVLVFF